MSAADSPARIGRHAGGRGHWSAKRVRRAATSGLFMGTTFFLADAISRLLFHRDFSSNGDSLPAFVSGLISYVVAVLGIGSTAACVAGIWKRLRHRPGGG